MLYKKLDNNCKYDTIYQVFVKKCIAAVYLVLGAKPSLGQSAVLNRRKKYK